jgi:putative endonuclease
VTSDRTGRRAEDRAVLWLRLKGWRIVERRWRTPVGEIDLVARRGGVLAFVEVKARPDRAAGLLALQPRQQRRLRRAAEFWLSGHPRDGNLTLRFDLVVIAPWRLPLHVENVLDGY